MLNCPIRFAETMKSETGLNAVRGETRVQTERELVMKELLRMLAAVAILLSTTLVVGCTPAEEEATPVEEVEVVE